SATTKQSPRWLRAIAAFAMSGTAYVNTEFVLPGGRWRSYENNSIDRRASFGALSRKSADAGRGNFYRRRLGYFRPWECGRTWRGAPRHSRRIVDMARSQ